MQWSGESAQAGVPVQPMHGNPGMSPVGGGNYVAGVWQSRASTLELNDMGAAHPKTQQAASVIGVGSTLQPARDF